MGTLAGCYISQNIPLSDQKAIDILAAQKGSDVKALQAYKADIEQDIQEFREKYIIPELKKAGIDPAIPTAEEAKPAPKKPEPKVKQKVETEKTESPAPVVDFIKASAEQFPKAIANATEKLTNVAGKTIEQLLAIKGDSTGIHKIPDSAFRDRTTLSKALVDLKIPKESADILADSFRNYVLSYNKITVGVEAEKKELVKALVKTGLTNAKAEAQVKSKGLAVNNYSKEVQKIIGDIDLFAIRQPLTMLFRDNDGKVPPQVLFSMMVNSTEWIQQNTNSNIFMSEVSKQRFLYGTQDRGELSTDEQTELDDVGHSWKLTSNMLGQSVASMLKISAKDKESSLFYDNLVTALGMAALEISQTSANNKTAAPITINTKVWNFEEAQKEERTFNNNERYLHITMKEDLKISKDRRTAFNDAMSILNKDGELDSQVPLQKPAKSVVNSIRNSFGGVPIKVATALRKMQQVAWGTNETMPLFEALAEKNMRAVRILAKLKDVNETTSHNVWKEHADSSNKNKIDNITAILEQKQEGNLDNFFFKYKLMNQHRIMMDGHINPQNSKVARAVLAPKVSKEVYTKENIHLFKLAILSNLGFQIDKNLPTEITTIFDEYMDDPLIIKAIAAVEDNKINEVADLALEIQSKYGGDISILSALTALVKYAPFHGGDIKSFSSDILIESDGITNGFAMNVLQFPLFDERTLEKHLNQMGTYFGKTTKETTHLISGIYQDPENTQEAVFDAYLDLAQQVSANDGLSVAQEFYDNVTPGFANMYKEASVAIDQIHPQLRNSSTRDFVKYPFITYQYGAGISSITESVAQDVVLEMYKRIGELQAEYNSLDTDSKKAGFVKSDIKPYEQHLTNLLVNFTIDKESGQKVSLTNAITNSKIQSNKIVFNSTPVINRISKVLAPRFSAGLTALLGSSKESREAVVKAGEILNTVFNVHLDKEVTKRESTGKKLSPSEINELVRTELIKWLPQYKGPLIALNEKAFVDLSKQVRDRSSKSTTKDAVEFVYVNEQGKRSSRNNSPTNTKFINPGVSALIRLIINMDSSLMAASLTSEPNVLTLYDAVIGSPSRVARIAKVYGKKYLEFGMQHSVMQNINDQMNKVLADTRAEDKANGTKLELKVRELLRKDGFRNTGEAPVNLDESVKTVREETARVAAARDVLREKISRLGAKSHQLFFADIAASNPAANKSFGERSNDILNALKTKQKEIFFNLKPVKAFSLPVKQAMTALFRRSGTSTALNILKEYSSENAFDYIEIAKEDKNNINLLKALSTIQSKLNPEDAISAERVLSIFLQTDPSNLANSASNQLVIGEFINTVGEQNIDQFRQNIIDELESYSVAPDFAESDAVYNKQLEDLKAELLSLDSVPRENPELVNTFTINANTINKLFKQFTTLSLNYYNSDEARKGHTAVLKDVVDALAKGIESTVGITLNIEEIDGITQGQYNKTREEIRVSMSRQPPAAANGQSPQEIYVHELLHAVTTQAIRDNSLIAGKIEKAFNHVKTIINRDGKHQVFLRGITNPSPADIEMAKKQYNYLFDNTKNEVNKLPEFLAYATTNKALVAYLQDHTAPLPVRDNTLIGWLQSLVDLVVDGFTRLLRKATGNNIHQDMVAVVEQLVEIQQVHENRARRLFGNYVRHSDKYDSDIRRILSQVKKGVLESGAADAFREVSGAAINNIKIHMNSNAVSASVLRKSHELFSTAFNSIAKELSEGTLTRDLVNQLLQVKNNISKQNQILEVDMIEWFNKIWKAPNAVENMTAEQQEGLTDVFLRTELSSLLGANLSPVQIAALLGNPTLVQANLDKLRQLMNLPSDHRAILFAEELGNYMATGDTLLPNAHQNVASIAKNELTLEQRKDRNLLKRLKAYASLVALQKTDSRTVGLVKPLVNAEFVASASDNAIVDILQYHLRFTEASLKFLFSGNPLQTKQGWVLERVDNLTDMVTGTRGQAEEMRKAGYPEPFKLGKIPGVPSAHDYIYIGRNVPETKFVSGIMSDTGRHVAGTTIRNILVKNPDFLHSNGSPNNPKIRKHIARLGRIQNIKAQSLKQDPKTRLRPVRDDKGNIVNYRVEMNLESKRRLLNPDSAFQNVFAHMHSSASNKQQTIISDKATIDLLVHEQINLMPTLPEGSFVDILGPNSPFSKDRLNKIPKEVRLYLNQYAINGEFKVRADIIDKVFGFSAWDVGNLKILQGPERGWWRWAARLGQYLAQTVVSYGVDRIVIGTGSVIGGNLMSNMYALLMRKMPPSYIINKTFEGYQAYLKYQEDSTLMRRLRRDIESKNLPQTSEEQKEFFRAKTRLENNKLHPMVTAGLDSIIVEDLNEASTAGYFSRYNRILKKEENKGIRDAIPKSLIDIAKIAFMTKSSAPYRGLKHVVQLSDFLARYVMIEHAMSVKGQDFETAKFDAINAFVLFDENVTPGLDALNSVAGTLFVSYWMRNQRAARSLIKNSPTTVLASAGVQQATGLDTLASINSSFYGFDFSPNILQADNVFNKVTEVTTLANLEKLASASIFD